MDRQRQVQAEILKQHVQMDKAKKELEERQREKEELLTRRRERERAAGREWGRRPASSPTLTWVHSGGGQEQPGRGD